MRASTLVLFSAILVSAMAQFSPSVAGAQAHELDGLWIGAEEGVPDSVVTIRFRGPSLVFLDGNDLLVGTVRMPGSGTKLGAASVVEVDVELLRAFSYAGVERHLGKTKRSRTTLGLASISGDAMRICASEPGRTKRATVAPREHQKEAVPRCFDVRRWPGKAPGAPELFLECVRTCVFQSQMRAVAPHVIEADCRRECAGE